MIELQVNNTVVDLTEAANIQLQVFNTSGVSIDVTPGQVVPAVEIGVAMQGPQGIEGPKGDKGDTGDKLEFADLTELQKQELRGDVGDTSINYTNIFNSVLLA